MKSTTQFITRCKGLLSLSTPLTVFQWTFHNSGHLDFTVSSLNCGISLLVENPEERPCCFHLLRCLISLKGSGMGWGGEPGGVRETVWPASPPDPPGPHTLAHLLRIPAPFSRTRKTWTSNKQQWPSYLFSVFAEPAPQHNPEGLSWKAGMQIKQRLQICTYVSRYKRRIISNNLCKKKKKKVSGYILVEEKKKEKWRVGGTVKVLEAFFNSKIYRGAKVMFTR